MATGGQKINFNDGLFVPMDMFDLIVQYLTVSDHAHLSESSMKMMILVDSYEQSVLASFRSLPAPETNDVIFASNYIQKLTACVKCRPGMFRLKSNEIQAVYFVTYHITHHLLRNDFSAEYQNGMYPICIDTPHKVPTTLENEADVKSPTGDSVEYANIPSSCQYFNLACSMIRKAQQTGVSAVYWVNCQIGYKLGNSGDILHQLDIPTMSKDNYDDEVTITEVMSEPILQSSLSHSFDLACTVLRRAHQTIFHAHPPLISPELEKHHPNFFCNILNVMFHALNFIHDKPEFGKLWDQVKTERHLLQMYGSYGSETQ
jgi:hypothetical protein